MQVDQKAGIFRQKSENWLLYWLFPNFYYIKKMTIHPSLGEDPEIC